MRLLVIALLFFGGTSWGAEINCNTIPTVLGSAQTAQGPTTNYVKEKKKKLSAGFQAHINTGSATVSFQACCRDPLGAGKCTSDAEWGDMGGCSKAITAGGDANLFCPVDPMAACRYRGYIAIGTCLSSCNVDFTFECTQP